MDATPESSRWGDGASQNARESGRVTLLLQAAAGGDASAVGRLMDVVYGELRAIAQVRMNGERVGHTLEATALVNEAYLRLLGRDGVEWKGRAHFYRAAAEAMRKILIDHARARGAQKRGGGKAALSISSVADLAAEASPDGILALDDAILRLEGVDPEAAAVVRLRFYAGLGEKETAEALEISERTARREWAFARGWLRNAIESASRAEEDGTNRKV